MHRKFRPYRALGERVLLECLDNASTRNFKRILLDLAEIIHACDPRAKTVQRLFNELDGLGTKPDQDLLAGFIIALRLEQANWGFYPQLLALDGYGSARNPIGFADEIRDEAIGRRAINFARRADLLDPAGAQH